MERLKDLLGRCKEKRSKQEYELKKPKGDDPRYPDFYATMARLSLLDWFISELETIIND